MSPSLPDRERSALEERLKNLEDEIAVLKHDLQETTASPSDPAAPHPTPWTMRWPFVAALIVIALLVSAGILVPRLITPKPPAPQQPPAPSPAQFPVLIGWSGGGISFASFFVQVKNTTGQDVYVKSLELRGVQGSNCGLVPRFPELVPPHPFVRANDVRAVIPELQFNGVTQRELTLCEIKAIAVVVMSPTYPAPESPQNFVVSESRALGN